MLDAVAVGLAVAGQATRLALERLGDRVGAGAAIPARPDAVTTGWLTGALVRTFPDVRISAVRRLEHHAGTTTRARLALTYTHPGSGPAPPATVFVKLSPASTATRLFGNLVRLGETEVRFYRDLAPEVGIERPRVFYAASGGPAARFALVLEDLAARHARFTDVAHPLTLEDARLVMGMLARLHAGFWDSPRFGKDLGWLKGYGANPMRRLERFLWAAAVRPGLARFPEIVPEEVRAAVPRIVAAHDRLEAAWATGPRTLIHGDAHVGNMYFLANAAGLLDWQCVQRGQGMRDVSYFLVNSVPTEVRRAHERALIALYLDTLTAAGIAGPSPAAAWEQHRLHAVYTFIATLVTTAAAHLQPAPIARAGLARSATALRDLSSLAALEAC